jgi:hypothetical protein
MTRYPLDRLYGEVAYLAYYLHWGRDDLLSLEHAERRRWMLEVGRMHANEVGP